MLHAVHATEACDGSCKEMVQQNEGEDGSASTITHSSHHMDTKASSNNPIPSPAYDVASNTGIHKASTGGSFHATHENK